MGPIHVAKRLPAGCALLGAFLLMIALAGCRAASAGGADDESGNPDPEPPAPPTAVQATTTGYNAFSLSWVDASDTELGFRIYEGAVSGAPAVEVDSSTTTVSSYDLDYDGQPGAEVTYHVVSYNGAGESEPASVSVVPTGADYYVDGSSGSDANAGTLSAPFATISHAVDSAEEGALIKVFPGTYAASSGEQFPIALKEGQTLVGDPRNLGQGSTATVIDGGGDTGYTEWALPDYAAVLLETDADVSGFVFDDSGPRTGMYSVTIKDSGGRVSRSTFERGLYGGVLLYGTLDAVVEDSDFHASSYGIHAQTGSAPDAHIVNNSFHDGIVHLRDGSVAVEGNSFSDPGSGFAVYITGGQARVVENSFENPAGYGEGAIRVADRYADPGDGLYARGNSFNCMTGVLVEFSHTGGVDLGTGEDPGNNDFSGASGAGVVNYSTIEVDALGNEWSASTPQPGRDVLILSGGALTHGPSPGDTLHSEVEAYLNWRYMYGSWENKDLTENGHDSTAYNGADWEDTGYDTPYLFDGEDDYVELSGESGFDLDTFTITTEFRVDELGHTQTLLAKDSSEPDNTTFLLEILSDGRARYSHASFSLTPDDVDIQPGRYYALTVVVDGSIASLYLDGELRGTSTYGSFRPGHNDLPVTLGSSAVAPGNHLDGAIEAVRIYDAAISEEEVSSAYWSDRYIGY